MWCWCGRANRLRNRTSGWKTAGPRSWKTTVFNGKRIVKRTVKNNNKE